MIERDPEEERQSRLDAMVAEFDAARRRRLIKVGIALWNRAEAAQAALAFTPKPAPEKIH